MFVGLIWSSALLSLAPSSVTPSLPGPLPIVGGTDAVTCEWPSTVALNSFDTTFCSGTLMHPQVVLTAAHCIHPSGWGTPTDIVFGEQGSAPEFSVGVQGCTMHPEYDDSAQTHSPEDAYDLAYCVLTEPVLDVAPTPPLMGCEVEQLGPGGTVEIVGFGANFIEPDDGGGFDLGGIGTKRHITQTVEQIDALDQVFLLGSGGSACSGDSGGSAFVQLDDGSWRVFAATARNHPDAPDDPPWCVYGTVYTGIWNEMDWFESDSGFDLTPCHDADGTWNPGPDCTGFPLEPQGDAVWADGCAGQALSGEGATCAPDPGGTGDTGDTGDTEQTGTSGEAGQDTTAGSGGSGGSAGVGTTGPVPVGSTGLPGGTGDASTGDPGQVDSTPEGCGCRSTTGGAPGALGLAMLVLGWRRRRW